MIREAIDKVVSGRSLDMQEATSVMGEIMEGEATPAQLAALQFSQTLKTGRLIKRYKRFLADVQLDSGEEITAHCANPSSMLGLAEPGSRVWLSQNDNPKRKLKFSWEIIEVDLGAGPVLVGINTSLPNALVAEAIQSGAIAELSGYPALRREVKYGVNSRIDILLEKEDLSRCYV